MRVTTLVVGARHQGPYVVMDCFSLKPGDGLLLHREPDNPWDPNAVKVSNVLGGWVGYVQREVAWIVAAWMDNGYIVSARVLEEGTLTNGMVQRKADYPLAAIYREEPPGEFWEERDNVKWEKERQLEKA